MLCVCVFTGQPFDVIGLGVKVDQGLPCAHHNIPRSSGKPLQGPLMTPKLSHGHQSRTVAEPVKEILFFLAAIGTGGIL